MIIRITNPVDFKVDVFLSPFFFENNIDVTLLLWSLPTKWTPYQVISRLITPLLGGHWPPRYAFVFDRLQGIIGYRGYFTPLIRPFCWGRLWAHLEAWQRFDPGNIQINLSWMILLVTSTSESSSSSVFFFEICFGSSSEWWVFDIVKEQKL